MAQSARAFAVSLLVVLGACASQPPHEASSQPDIAEAGSAEKPQPAPQAVPSIAIALDATRLPPFDGMTTVLAQPPAVKTIDRTVPPADLWQRVRQGFGVPDLEGPLV